MPLVPCQAGQGILPTDQYLFNHSLLWEGNSLLLLLCTVQVLQPRPAHASGEAGSNPSAQGLALHMVERLQQAL